MNHQLATFELDGHLYGLPVAQVQEVLQGQQATRVPLAPGAVHGLMNLRGEVVPVIDLRSRLGLPPRDGEARAMNVVVRVAGEVVSMLVDRIGDVVTVDAQIFETPPETLDGIARELIRGAYKLDAELLLALDVDKTVAVAA